MCENCKNEELDIQEKEIELENRDVEAMFVEPIGLSTEKLVDIAEFDVNEFKKGITEASKECGIFTAYINAGMTNVQAYDLILTKLTLEYQKELNNDANKTAIEVSKNQVVVNDKNQV